MHGTQVEATTDCEDSEGLPAAQGRRRTAVHTVVADDPQIRRLAHAWLDAFIPDFIQNSALRRPPQRFAVLLLVGS